MGMKICKYCKKPIPDNDVWNPDSEGNGYHHACLIEIEFRSRNRQIYDKGRADVLDKIRAEIEDYQKDAFYSNDVMMSKKMVLDILDKYKAESEVDNADSN